MQAGGQRFESVILHMGENRIDAVNPISDTLMMDAVNPICDTLMMDAVNPEPDT